MSGPLIIGIVAVGGLWLVGCRQSAIEKSAIAPSTPKPPEADPAPASDSSTAGTTAIAGAAAGDAGNATIGGDSAVGRCSGGSGVPVKLGGDGIGGVVADPVVSEGGADPATIRSTVVDHPAGSDGGGFWAGPEGRDSDDRSALVDPIEMWARAKHGSTDGLTRAQIALLYTEVQQLTGEVVI